MGKGLKSVIVVGLLLLYYSIIFNSFVQLWVDVFQFSQIVSNIFTLGFFVIILIYYFVKNETAYLKVKELRDRLW